jgi:hypothetical protein
MPKNMKRVGIGVVWPRIQVQIGTQFTQIRGGIFGYTEQSGCIRPDRTNHQIPRSHFEAALALVPLRNTVPVQHLRGPSYIFAILMDPRIRCGDW